MDWFFSKGHLGVKESFISGLMKHNISAFHKQHISIFKHVELLFLDNIKTLSSSLFCWERFLNLSGFMNSFNFSKTLFVVGFTICQTQEPYGANRLCEEQSHGKSNHPGTFWLCQLTSCWPLPKAKFLKVFSQLFYFIYLVFKGAKIT